MSERLPKMEEDAECVFDLEDAGFLLTALHYACVRDQLKDIQLVTRDMRKRGMLCASLLIKHKFDIQQFSDMICCSDECVLYLLQHSILQFVGECPRLRGLYLLRVLFSTLMRRQRKTIEFLCGTHEINAALVLRTLNTFPGLTEHLFFLLFPDTLPWMIQKWKLDWRQLELNPTRVLFSMIQSSVFRADVLTAFLELEPDLPDSIWNYILQYYADRPEWSKLCCGISHFIFTHKSAFLRKMTVQLMMRQTAFPCLQEQATAVLPSIPDRWMYRQQCATTDFKTLFSQTCTAFSSSTGFETLIASHAPASLCPCTHCAYHHHHEEKETQEI